MKLTQMAVSKEIYPYPLLETLPNNKIIMVLEYMKHHVTSFAIMGPLRPCIGIIVKIITSGSKYSECNVHVAHIACDTDIIGFFKQLLEKYPPEISQFGIQLTTVSMSEEMYLIYKERNLNKKQKEYLSYVKNDLIKKFLEENKINFTIKASIFINNLSDQENFQLRGANMSAIDFILVNNHGEIFSISPTTVDLFGYKGKKIRHDGKLVLYDDLDPKTKIKYNVMHSQILSETISVPHAKKCFSTNLDGLVSLFGLDLDKDLYEFKGYN